MPNCLKCGNELSPDVKFCVVCGAKVPRCPTCGRIISERSRFCTADGTQFSADILAMIGIEAMPDPAPKAPAAQDTQENPADAPKPRPAKSAGKKKSGGGNGKIAALAVILAVLIAVLIGVIYWFFLRSPASETGTAAPDLAVTEEENVDTADSANVGSNEEKTEQDKEIEETETEAPESGAAEEQNEAAEPDVELPAYDHTPEGFVKRAYVELLGRDADADGLKTWTNALESGEVSAAGVIIGMCSGDEFAARNLSDDEIISCLYRAALGREPDEAGLEAWVGALESGKSLRDIVTAFTDCDEFAAVCNEFGIR